MGAGIVIIVVGIAFGGLMVAAPKGIWWATESWKFRHPEANEPSDASYAMTRMGGVLVIIGSLLFGGMFIKDAREQAAKERAKQETATAEANFTRPAPERRGTLPVIGYRSTPAGAGEPIVKVYYAAPTEAYPEFFRKMSAPSDISSFPCYAAPTITPRPDGGVSVDVELIWAPLRLSDMKRADDCRFGRRHRIDDVSVGRLPGGAPVVTDGAIADVNGVELHSAATDNAVPRLTEEPPEQSATVYDRGPIPILGYRIDDGKLNVTYLLPADADARGGSLGGTSAYGGCEVVPVMTGLGTDTVTVDLRLRFSDPMNYYGEKDEACKVDGKWSTSPNSSSWGEASEGTTVLTNGPIVNRGGAVMAPAAPGNRVPAQS